MASSLQVVCVASETSSSRRMLSTTVKLTGYVRHVESHDFRNLWRRLTLSADEPMPDAVLLYHDGPHALNLLDRIRSTPEIETLPVVVVTPETTANDVLAAMERDADDCMLTPIVPEKLAHRLRAIIGRRKSPSPYEQMLALGKKALRAGDPLKAQEYFAEALAMKPDATSALYYCGLGAEMQGDLESAVQYYTRAARFRMNLRAQERLCAIYFKQGDYQAMEPLVNHLHQYITLPSAWLVAAGKASFSKGNVDDAVRNLRQAHRRWVAEGEGNKASPYTPLGGLVEGLQRYPKHPKYLDVCVAIAVDFERNRTLIERLSFDERMALGTLAFHAERLSEARRFWLKALDVAPDEKAKLVVHKKLAATYKKAGVDRLAKEHEKLGETNGAT